MTQCKIEFTYASHCTMGLSPLDNCIIEIRPLLPFSKETIVSERNIRKITFTFDTYLGTS